VIGNPPPLGPIGNTPSWNPALPGFAPGADCTLSLVLVNPYRGSDKFLAVDEFRVDGFSSAIISAILAQ
jgi:hypothetical protein